MKQDLSAETLLNPKAEFIIGIDEVGRGCIAGPVAACAYIFHRPQVDVPTLRDSKKLSAHQRRTLQPLLLAAGKHGYGEASSTEIDTLRIDAANFLAMRRALDALKLESLDGYLIVVDGNKVPDLGPIGTATIVCIEKADDKIPAVSAAAVLAKVRRDEVMAAAARDFPGYGFEKHAGYPVTAHLRALQELGPCPLHRRSFRPLSDTPREPTALSKMSRCH